VIPVAYGEGVADQIRAASGGKVDAFIDTFGGSYVDLALELGVAPERNLLRYYAETERVLHGAVRGAIHQHLLRSGYIEGRTVDARGALVRAAHDQSPIVSGGSKLGPEHTTSVALGHNVRLIPAQYVKPFRKEQKNDYRDAEANAEALQRPTMRIPKSSTSRRATSTCGGG
jgi:hypothetical protein